jgi:hypothetical protein
MTDDVAHGAGEKFLHRGDSHSGRRARAFVGGQNGLLLPAVIAGASIGEQEFVTHDGNPKFEESKFESNSKPEVSSSDLSA